MTNHKKTALGLIVIIIAALVIFWISDMRNNPRAAGMTTYVQEDFDFEITFPSDWAFRDELTKQSCCLIIAAWTTSTTTALNASGTPVEAVTAREHIKLQIGYYDRAVDDPFKVASTTKVTLGRTEFYTGTTTGMQFYLLPRDENEGVGVALFAYLETTEEHMEAARKIISSIKLLPKD